MTNKPRDRMIFDLTPDDRAALERLRVARGLRSHAEVLRALIREGGLPPAPMRSDRETYPAKAGAFSADLDRRLSEATAGIPVLGTFERKAKPKGAK